MGARHVRRLVGRYRFLLVMLVVLGAVALANAPLAREALTVTAWSLREMVLIIPPIFVLLGLLDVWVPRQTMVRFMGDGSGIIGALLGVFLGSAAAGPLYGAFPVAAVLLKKGASVRNTLIFIGAWSTTKIPMVLFELKALGPRFALTRLAASLVGVTLIAVFLERLLSDDDREELVRRAGELAG